MMRRTTMGKLINAYVTLIRTGKQMPPDLKTSRKLFNLRKALEPHFEFYSEEQAKIIDEFGGKEQENGVISFGPKADKAEYSRRIAELNKLEVDVDFDPVKLSENTKLPYTPDDLWQLDGFVEITD